MPFAALRQRTVVKENCISLYWWLQKCRDCIVVEEIEGHLCFRLPRYISAFQVLFQRNFQRNILYLCIGEQWLLEKVQSLLILAGLHQCVTEAGGLPLFFSASVSEIATVRICCENSVSVDKGYVSTK